MTGGDGFGGLGLGGMEGLWPGKERIRADKVVAKLETKQARRRHEQPCAQTTCAYTRNTVERVGLRQQLYGIKTDQIMYTFGQPQDQAPKSRNVFADISRGALFSSYLYRSEFLMGC